MNEIETWFMEELGHLGFSLTPMMFESFTFTPTIGIMYTHSDNGVPRTIKLRTLITPNLANDVQGWGRTYENEVDDYRQIIIDGIHREIERLGLPFPNRKGDITPNKIIRKFKFNDK